MRTLASHPAYYQRWAKTWEFQALLKARPIAGDLDARARSSSTSVAPLVWSAAERPNFVADVQAMRRRVVEQLPPAQADHELKLGPGGLRDIEFAVQLLQLVHGRSDPDLRPREHLVRPRGADPRRVRRTRRRRPARAPRYSFLRTLEHRLQLQPPASYPPAADGPRELRTLGRRSG